MWEALVMLVRLPVTCAWLVFTTVVGVPFILITRMAFFVFGYIIAPLVLLKHAFDNEKQGFRKHLEETDKMLQGIPEHLGNMYKDIFKWGFPI